MIPDDRHVFHDPSGRRDRRAKLAFGIVLSVIAAVIAGFLATLAFAPHLPAAQLSALLLRM